MAAKDRRTKMKMATEAARLADQVMITRRRSLKEIFGPGREASSLPRRASPSEKSLTALLKAF